MPPAHAGGSDSSTKVQVKSTNVQFSSTHATGNLQTR